MAHHNIMKLSEEYRAKYWQTEGAKNPTGKGLFYLDDYWQLVKGCDNEIDQVWRALEAGFMVGYKQAQKDARKKAKAKRSRQTAAGTASKDQ